MAYMKLINSTSTQAKTILSHYRTTVIPKESTMTLNNLITRKQATVIQNDV